MPYPANKILPIQEVDILSCSYEGRASGGCTFVMSLTLLLIAVRP